MSKQEGHWLVYHKPREDENGWYIATENTETKETGRVDYADQETADAAYMGMIMGRFQARN
jgi:hypothetical protein